MVNQKKNTVLNYTSLNQGLSSKEIFDGLNFPGGYSTLKRLLVQLTGENLLVTRGLGKARRYYLSSGNSKVKLIFIEKWIKPIFNPLGLNDSIYA